VASCCHGVGNWLRLGQSYLVIQSWTLGIEGTGTASAFSPSRLLTYISTKGQTRVNNMIPLDEFRQICEPKSEWPVRAFSSKKGGYRFAVSASIPYYGTLFSGRPLLNRFSRFSSHPGATSELPVSVHAIVLSSVKIGSRAPAFCTAASPCSSMRWP
jgi:hypothetical protein